MRARHLPVERVAPALPSDASLDLEFLRDRKPWQFVASVRSYLLWREGASWRPLRHRFHPDKLPYTHAINTVNWAEASYAASCSCGYCRGAQFAAPPSERKKPVRSAAISRAATDRQRKAPASAGVDVRAVAAASAPSRAKAGAA